SASLMGEYDVKAEEDAIREVLAGRKQLDDVVRSVDDVKTGGGVAGLLAQLFRHSSSPAAEPLPVSRDQAAGGLYSDPVAFLRDALTMVFKTPAAAPDAGGVGWREHPQHAMVALVPSPDLRQRLDVLPQSYLRERKVAAELRLATSTTRGNQALE